MHTIRQHNEFVDNTANLEFVKEQISAAAQRSGRGPDDVSLVAVSKAFKAATIMPILAAGQRVFGENRVREAVDKWVPLGNTPAPNRFAAEQQSERCNVTV